MWRGLAQTRRACGEVRTVEGAAIIEETADDLLVSGAATSAAECRSLVARLRRERRRGRSGRNRRPTRVIKVDLKTNVVVAAPVNFERIDLGNSGEEVVSVC